ncbi:SGNH/GDSL hydrolase family protein [Flavitalea sp.]|nr:GDSL-type esterase/lipase family protein [Flavitalea sp.]
MAATSFKYLALGDSYTVGEGVETGDSFPFQLVRTLNETVKKADNPAEQNPGLPGKQNPKKIFEDPVIIAKTGWTTSELIGAVNDANLKTNFDIVTLLIGVNNQYRGLAPDEYGLEFGQLASVALNFAGNNPSGVFVLSIPDWSAAPFAADRDREMISFTIDRFNELNRQISLRQGFHYIDITKGSRDVLNDASLVTKDNLHPSATEYRKWSDQLVPLISHQLSIQKVDQTAK